MNLSSAFEHQQYLNLETFRKSGQGVKTPVWFVEDEGVLFIRTDGTSGKVKRIRNNHHVKIAPCKMDGVLLGEWINASASLVNDPAIDQKVDRMLSGKYGLLKFLFGLGSLFQGRKYAILKIQLEEI
jgi:PPOX class probable F420-dependent enzyme